MSNKDFLSQFSDENKKPDSFKEEVRIPIQKEKKPIKPWMIVVPAVVMVLLLVLGWFFFLRPTIEVPDFLGKTQNEVSQWVVQQGIEKTGIVFNEEFSMEYDKGVITYQSVDAGKKVKKDVKINFTMSKGADPDEAITLPDIKNMTQSELNEWKSKNKLDNTKITTSYSDEVEEGNVISFSLRGCEADSFTRGCTLNISVSKGSAPAGTIQITDFKNNALSAVEDWATKNKVTLDVRHVFDESIMSGQVVSTSPAAGKTIKQGETLTVMVSQGKGIKVPDFSKMANKEIDNWVEENSQYVDVTKKYFNKTGYIISQSVKTGGMIGTEDKLELCLNLGNSFYLEDIGLNANSIIGMQYDKLVDALNNNRYLGIDAYAGQWGENKEVYSDKYSKGQVVSIKCEDSTGKEFSCSERLPLDARLSVVLSKGIIKDIDISSARIKDTDSFNISKIVSILSDNNISFINKADGQACRILLNGKPVEENAIRVILEEDEIVLESSNVDVPPVEIPTTPDTSGAISDN